MNLTTFEDIFDPFLAKISDYDELPSVTEEDFNSIVDRYLRSALAKFTNKGDIKADFKSRTFNKELDDYVIEVIASLLVVEWLTPQINNTQLTKQAMTSKDYNLTSQRNHLTGLIQLRKTMKKEATYLANRYSLLNTIEENKNE